VTALVDPNRLDWFLTWARHAAPVALEETEAKPKAVRQRLARAVKESISPQQRLEAGVHPWSAFFVLPVFALANAGVAISIASAFNPITLAIIVGLTVGKPLGIFAFAWFAVEFGLARKPEDITWLMLLAAGLLAGIGFTMALFIANLAFQGDALEAAKLGILTASLISGVVGMVLLRTLSVKKSSSC
jgi:Na+:H+ antiporter, NhaA family